MLAAWDSPQIVVSHLIRWRMGDALLHEHRDLAALDVVVGVERDVHRVNREAEGAVEADRRYVGGLCLADEAAQAVVVRVSLHSAHQRAANVLSLELRCNVELADGEAAIPALRLA